MTSIIRYPLDSSVLNFDPDQDDMDTFLHVSEHTTIVDDAVAEALGYAVDDPKWEAFARPNSEFYYYALEDIWSIYGGFFIDHEGFVVEPDLLKSWADKCGDRTRQEVDKHWNNSRTS